MFLRPLPGKLGCDIDRPQLAEVNGMDAPFLNRHRGAKAEVQSNHF
jgi:hypothetical protein